MKLPAWWWVIAALLLGLFLWAAISAWLLAVDLGSDALERLGLPAGQVNANDLEFFKRVWVLGQLVVYVNVLSIALLLFIFASYLVGVWRKRKKQILSVE